MTGPADGDARLTELMRGYQQGRLDAFEELYARLAGRLRGFLSRRGREPARVEDLLQETFLQLHRARHTYDPAFPVMPWALAIARHVELMDHRTAKRRPQYVPADAAPEPSVVAEVEQLAARDSLDAALGTLVPSRRDAVILHHVWGWSFREIGRRFGIAEAAAKLRSSRGIAQLRTIMRAQDGAPPRKETRS